MHVKYTNDKIQIYSKSMPLYYKKPIYYMVIHIVMGSISYYYRPFIIVYLLYQLGQWYIGKRFFLFQWKIEDGNSWFHTFIKIGEFMIGWIFVYFINLIKQNTKVICSINNDCKGAPLRSIITSANV